MEKISLDCSQVLDFINSEDIDSLQEKINNGHKMLHKEADLYNEYLGWVEIANNYDEKEFHKIKEVSQKIKKQSDVFIVIGIGGSYLGARAAIEMLNNNFYNELPKEKRNGPKIYFAGHNISSSYVKDLFDIIGDQDLSINVISKSGTTTEPAIAFRLFKEYMENRYGRLEASKRIYVTTDRDKGALKLLADKEGYESFVIPDDIGGRYSVLTSVGLLPMAVGGIDIEQVMKGGQAAAFDLSVNDVEKNPAYKYAAVRNTLYTSGKTMEIMVNYEPNLLYFGEWYKQLFGESEGKDGKGIFPTTLNFTTDLHSMGQYIQDGRKNIFETVLNIEKSKDHITLKEDKANTDGLNYISGKTLDFINKKAMEGSVVSHVEGGAPNIMINIPEISAYYMGYLFYFFQKACAMSGYLLDVNPFDQPGVEVYKTNMFRLLGKPGYNYK